MSSIYNSKLRVLDRAPSTTTRRLFSSPDRAPSINITVPYIIPSAPPPGAAPSGAAHLRRRPRPARSPSAAVPSGALTSCGGPLRRGSPPAAARSAWLPSDMAPPARQPLLVAAPSGDDAPSGENRDFGSLDKVQRP
jgi:hypothetical protein